MLQVLLAGGSPTDAVVFSAAVGLVSVPHGSEVCYLRFELCVSTRLKSSVRDSRPFTSMNPCSAELTGPENLACN